jgi:hypothetical protein
MTEYVQGDQQLSAVKPILYIYLNSFLISSFKAPNMVLNVAQEQ